MKRLAVVLALLAGHPAGALSVQPGCDPAGQTIPQAFRQFDGYANDVVMAVGELRKGTLFSEVIQSRESTRIFRAYDGTFRGKAATPEGFTTPFLVPVRIDQICRDDACFPDFSAGRWLVFLQKTRDGYLFEVFEGDCTPSGFANPSEADLAQAINCLNGTCE